MNLLSISVLNNAINFAHSDVIKLKYDLWLNHFLCDRNVHASMCFGMSRICSPWFSSCKKAFHVTFYEIILS